MNYRIVEMPNFYFVGRYVKVKKNEDPNQALDVLASSVDLTTEEQLLALCDSDIKELIQLSYSTAQSFDDPEGEMIHLIGIISLKDITDTDFAVIEMPACEWAVFPSEGDFPLCLQQTLNDVYFKWLPESKYNLAAHLSFSYTQLKKDDEQNTYSEVWVPVLPIEEA